LLRLYFICRWAAVYLPRPAAGHSCTCSFSPGISSLAGQIPFACNVACPLLLLGQHCPTHARVTREHAQRAGRGCASIKPCHHLCAPAARWRTLSRGTQARTPQHLQRLYLSSRAAAHARTHATASARAQLPATPIFTSLPEGRDAHAQVADVSGRKQPLADWREEQRWILPC